MTALRVNRSVAIPLDELQLNFSPSGGPGGQHANKSSTRAEVVWNVHSSNALGPRQKERVLGALRKRIDRSGNLRMSSDRYRSQTRNREDVLQRLSRVVAEALLPKKARVATSPTRGAHEKRLRAKKRRAEIKRARGRPDLEGDG